MPHVGRSAPPLTLTLSPLAGGGTGTSERHEQLDDRLLADAAGPRVLGGRGACGRARGAAADPAQPRRAAARAVAGRAAAGALQSDAAAGGAREPLQHRHRRPRRVDQPDHRRPARADGRHQARPRRQARRARHNLQVRWVTSSKPTGETSAGTNLFTDLNSALANTPPDRLAGVIMITDGQVHDVPEVGADAGLRCARPRPAHRPARRVRPPHRGSQGAALRHRRLHARDRGPRGRDRPPRPRRRPRHPQGAPRGPARRDAHRADRAHRSDPDAVPARRPEHRRDRARDGAGRAHPRQQPRGRGGRGRAREPARAAGVGRAARRRARVAQPAQVRRGRRPRALHDPAPAAEAGRHADPSALADRLPDARAVLGEDQGLRPHHLRPLPAPRHPPAALLREHRPLRGAGRRAAGRRRRRLRRPDEPVAHAAVRGAAGDAHRPPARAALQGAGSRPTASSIPSRAGSPAPRAPMPARTRPGAAGSARSTWCRAAAAPS